MENEALLRLSVFIGLFGLFALMEWALPRRARRTSQTRRWATNWAIVVLDTLTLRVFALVLPLLAVGAAIDAGAKGWGLLNQFDLPFVVNLILTILIFDFVIWLQHVASHKIPLLWRIHRVHHADRDMDVTTAIRFHPVEIVLSMLLKIGLVYAIGPAAWAVVIFEVILNGSAMFNHANIKLPLGLDRALRLFMITPDMHRIHHSVQRAEHDTNYGFALSWWDRLFGTYTVEPAKGHDAMDVGLHWQDERPNKLGWSLALPFRK
ncbi:sterol desaturase family protein [Algirhabdus cladophorae]|uniref:sterol desaturase family protein n=1 Tax=Algirhabdus cladophorae TaxID=3377108 RepID=UPI003B847860